MSEERHFYANLYLLLVVFRFIFTTSVERSHSRVFKIGYSFCLRTSCSFGALRIAAHSDLPVSAFAARSFNGRVPFPHLGLRFKPEIFLLGCPLHPYCPLKPE